MSEKIKKEKTEKTEETKEKEEKTEEKPETEENEKEKENTQAADDNDDEEDEEIHYNEGKSKKNNIDDYDPRYVDDDDYFREKKKRRKNKKKLKTGSDYKSDQLKEKYYQEAWRELCEEAGTKKTEDLLFMDILVELSNDTQRQKNRNKRRYFRWEFVSIMLIFLNTLTNSANLALDGIWNTVLNISGFVIGALIAAVTAYKLLIAPKDQWIRHSMFFYKITIEADWLFGGGEEYDSLTAKEKINKFKRKIVTYSKEDYQDFFANMTGNKSAELLNTGSSNNSGSVLNK